MNAPPKTWSDHFAALAIAVLAGVVLYFLLHHREAPPIVVRPEPPRQDRRQLIVVRSTRPCPPCDRLERITLADPRVAERIARDFTLIRASGKDAQARYGVTAFPTYLIVDGERGAIRHGTGYRTPDEFLAWLDAAPRLDAEPQVLDEEPAR